MRRDSVYATAMRGFARVHGPLRCATCWGRVRPADDLAMFDCENGHQVAMIAYERWRGDARERTGRTTGLVIGPSQRNLRTIDLGELAFQAMARERTRILNEFHRYPGVLEQVVVEAMVEELLALRERIAFLEGRLAGRDAAAS